MKKKLKILYVCESFPPYGLGAAISTSLLIKEISKKHQCIIITENYQKYPWEFHGVKVFPMLSRISFNFNSFKEVVNHGINLLIGLPINFGVLSSFIKKEKPDLINVVSTSHHSIPAILASIHNNIPVIVDIRGGIISCPKRNSNRLYKANPICKKDCFSCFMKGEIKRSNLVELLRPFLIIFELGIFKFWFYQFKKNFNKIQKFVAISEFVEKGLTEEGIQKNNIIVIRNISEQIKDKRITKRKKKITFAGRIVYEKGIWDAIKALELINDKNLVFEIAGDGSELENIKHYIKKNKIKNIKLLGRLSNEEVLRIYLKSKIIIAPSIIPEGFGRFIQESISTQTPCVSTKVGAVPEGIKDHETGLLVEPNNPKQLARAIKELLTDKKLYNKIVNNLAKEQKKYSSERIGKQRLKLYEELIKENKK